MAQYNFAIPSFRIHDCRSLFTDTLAASMSLVVNNVQGGFHSSYPIDPAAGNVKLGDHAKETTVSTPLLFENVDVPDPTADAPDGGSISWVFLLVNKGHQDSIFLDALIATVNDLAKELAKNSIKDDITLQVLGDLGLDTLKFLLSLLVANCDGTVASLTKTFSAAQLAQMTSNPSGWEDGVLCPGTDSPAGCGSNSKYTVYFNIINTNSLINVPTLIGKSPEEARTLAQQAGFGFHTVSAFIGRRGDPPRVDEQIPGPGSRVPPGSEIEAVVVFPSKTGVEL
jgi:PASTA domain